MLRQQGQSSLFNNHFSMQSVFFIGNVGNEQGQGESGMMWRKEKQTQHASSFFLLRTFVKNMSTSFILTGTQYFTDFEFIQTNSTWFHGYMFTGSIRIHYFRQEQCSWLIRCLQEIVVIVILVVVIVVVLVVVVVFLSEGCSRSSSAFRQWLRFGGGSSQFQIDGRSLQYLFICGNADNAL